MGIAVPESGRQREQEMRRREEGKSGVREDQNLVECL
jgi:hypothetical protein